MKTLARQRDKAEVLERLRAVRPESVARWGRMSAHQMVCHLSDGFRMAMGEKAVRPTSGVFHRTILRWIVLYAPLRWPSGVPTSPEIDQELHGTKPVDFAGDRAQLQELLIRVSDTPRMFDWQEHPVFGWLSEAAWLRWAYLHMDHHLRQFGA